ncbi:MAG: hypothetical protein ACK5OU_19720, partial [Dolichospermum sp.]
NSINIMNHHNPDGILNLSCKSSNPQHPDMATPRFAIRKKYSWKNKTLYIWAHRFPLYLNNNRNLETCQEYFQ